MSDPTNQNIFIHDVTDELCTDEEQGEEKISLQVKWQRPQFSGSPPAPRGGHTATFVNGIVYLIGGKQS
jgi:hypothetical protein